LIIFKIRQVPAKTTETPLAKVKSQAAQDFHLQQNVCSSVQGQLKISVMHWIFQHFGQFVQDNPPRPA